MGRIKSSNDQLSNPKQVTIDGTTYIAPDENFIGKLTFSLSQQIRNSKKIYDRLIYLPRGGLAFARQVLDCTGILKFSDTTVTSYSGIRKKGKVKIIKPLTDSIKGESILVLDDIADSGDTLVESKKYLLSLGATNVDIGVIYTKLRSLKLSVKPDYFAAKIPDNAWVVFPGERAEFIKNAFEKWSKDDISYKECKSRLSKIGLPSWYIDTYLKTF